MTKPGTSAIIPVKELSAAKQRLAGVLTPAVRYKLALAMLQDLLVLLGGLAELETIFVVTADTRAASLARDHGARVLAETRSSGINSAVAMGLAAVRRQGNARALVLPADIPLATRAEISRLLQEEEQNTKPRIVIAPSRDGEGTNGLLVPASSGFQPSYGAGSFIRHLSQAVARKYNVEIMQLAGLGCDIDMPADLEILRATRMTSPRYNFLATQLHEPQQDNFAHGE